MIQLNLPSCQIKLSGTKDSPRIWDILRHKYVRLTPEEWVRQHFIHYLIEHRGCPPALMSNEMEMKIGGKRLRADTVVYRRGSVQPLALVEYKAPTVPIRQSVFNQVSAYNILMRVDYLIVSNGMQHYCCKMNYESRSYTFLDTIPDYMAMMEGRCV